MKLRNHKHGAGGGGMGMMMPILMILIFAGLMMCQKDKKKTEQPKPPEQPPVSPSPPSGNVSNACLDDGFYVCDECSGEVIDLPAGTNKVCCDAPCEGCPELISPLPGWCQNGTIIPLPPDEHGCYGPQQCMEGNNSLSCAFQKGFACKDTENCLDKQWLATSDTQRCCKVQCKARVQTELVFGDLGKVVIERFGAGKFGVYYGPNVPIGGVDVGKANYVDAVAKGNKKYDFTVNKKIYTFTITKETETEIVAQAVITPSEPVPERGTLLDAKAYLLQKYNPGICFGLPRVVTETERAIVMMPDMVAYVKQRFGVTSDHDIYTKIVQLNGIVLQPTIAGYDFILTDGHCCTITTSEGKLNIAGNIDEVTKKEAKNVPC